MISLFTIAPNDQSIVYLSQIFGLVGNVFPSNVQSGPLLFSVMFQVLNSMALVVGTLLVVYITVVGIMNTAHDGEFMGKKWNGMWVPIRMVFGMILLFPTASGYAVIQIIMMWIIVQGIGSADKLWTTILEYTATMGSPYSTINTSSIPTSNISTHLGSLFQALTCQASTFSQNADIDTTNYSYQNLSNKTVDYTASYYCNHNATTDPYCQQTSTELLNITKEGVNDYVYPMGPSGACGKVTYCDANTASTDTASQCSGSNGKPISDTSSNAVGSLNCTSCLAQQAILQTIVTTFGGQIAPAFVSADHDYLVFNTQGATTPSWIASYCSNSSQGIPSANCCAIAPIPTAEQTAQIAAGQMAAPSCSNNFGITTLPAYKYDANSGTYDVRRADPTTISRLIYPYSISPYTNGSDIIAAATSAYVASMSAAVNTYLESQMANTQLTGWQADAEQTGWAYAGAYYYAMANANQSNIKASALDFSVSSPNLPSIGQNYRLNYDAAGDLLTAIQQAANAGKNTPSSSMPSEYQNAAAAVGGTSATLLGTFMSNISNNVATHGNGNPLASIATFGYQMMITAQVLFWVLVAMVASLTAILTIDPMVLGTGLTTEPAGQAFMSVVGFVGPLITIMISSIYTLGVLLGVYVPLIPYVVFSMGVVGWMIGTIEAMIASPFIALGMMSPAGQHEILGRAENSVMMIFNLFLRPTLMIFGLMAAMLMSAVAVRMINSGFQAITSYIISAPGLFEEIAFIAAYTSLLITVLNKTFSLIYMIPERVLTWIGGQAVSYGEGEALGQVQRGIEGAGAASAGGGKGAAGGAGEGAVRAGGAADKKEAANRKAAASAAARQTSSK